MPLPLRVTYRPEPASVALARQDTVEHFAGVLPDETLHELTLIVSELVTNSIIHGAGEVEVRMDVRDGVVRGEIVDHGDGFQTKIAQASPDQIGGRGLKLVDDLVQQWGVYDASAHVWFHLPLRGASQVEADIGIGRPDADALPDV